MSGRKKFNEKTCEVDVINHTCNGEWQALSLPSDTYTALQLWTRNSVDFRVRKVGDTSKELRYSGGDLFNLHHDKAYDFNTQWEVNAADGEMLEGVVHYF